MAKEDKEDTSTKENVDEQKKRVDMDPLLRYLFEPTLKQLRGLTNIPLGQVNNLAWMAVFDVATVQLAEYIEYLDKKRVALALVESEILSKPREAYKEAFGERQEIFGLCDERIEVLLPFIDSSKRNKVNTQALEVETQEVEEIKALYLGEAREAFDEAKALALEAYTKAEEAYVSTHKPPEVLSLSEVWSEIYSWLRRSIDGAGIMTASGLAMKQLELQEMSQEPGEVIDYR